MEAWTALIWLMTGTEHGNEIAAFKKYMEFLD